MSQADKTFKEIGVKRATAATLLLINLLVLVAATALLSSPVQADASNQVGLIVRFSDSSIFTACIEFSEPELTGEEILDRSGLSVTKDVSYGLGAAICRIEGDGCKYPQEHCFCQCQGATCEYWAYYHLDAENNRWVYSGMGASWHTVQHGEVEGWAWGPGDVGGSEVEPPLIPFGQLCTPPTATPTNSPTPTHTPEPSPPLVTFTARPENVLAGECAELYWHVENAQAVVLDGEGVRLEDTRQVCPSQGRTYELRVLNAAGEFHYQVTINVRQPTFTPLPTGTATPVPSATSRPTDVPETTTETPMLQATSVVPPAAPLDTPVAPPTPPLTTPTATPTLAPTVVAMIDQPAMATIEEVTDPPAQVAPAEPSLQERVTLGRILLLIGVSAGTLGFGGLAFLGILLLLITVYLRARVLFADDRDME